MMDGDALGQPEPNVELYRCIAPKLPALLGKRRCVPLSFGGLLRGRCAPKHPRTRVHGARRPSVSLLDVDRASGPR